MTTSRPILPLTLPEGYWDGTYYYAHYRDYQNAVRATAANGRSYADNHYYPYGVPFSISTDFGNPLPDRRLYGDKEMLTFLGYNTYDYSARHYFSPAASFDTPDPKAHDFTWISPYTFCAGNPVMFIDEDGCRPIYSTTGEFLGTDDTGLTGDYIIMEEKNFEQNMSQELANENIVDPNTLSKEIISSINTHYETLPSRPDYDGKLTLSEANEWYRNGNGEQLFVDADKVDLGINTIGEVNIGKKEVINLFCMGGTIEDMLVYGNVTVEYITGNEIKISTDNYGFEMHPLSNGGNPIRNILTKIGAWYAGEGVPYNINFYGIKRIN